MTFLCDVEYPECTDQEFECNSGQCISAVKRCDGINDCFDGFDEAEELCGK